MKRILYSILLFISIVFVSCEDVIEVEMNAEDQNLFVVEAKITTIDSPYCFLYHALPVGSTENYTGVSDAVVTITDDAVPANTIQLIENETKKGFYQVPVSSDYTGQTDRTYTITIEKDDIIISAEEYLAPVSIIDSIQVHSSLRGEHRFLGIFTFGNEPVGLGNNYKWDVYVNDTLITNVFHLTFVNDDMVDGRYISDFEIMTDFHDPDDESERILKFKDTIQVKQTSISAFVYDYYLQLVNQSSTGSLFSVPTANIKSNYTSSDGKKVLGLFSAHDVSVSNKVVIDESIETQIRKN